MKIKYIVYKNNKAVTLVEILISIIIIATAFFPIIKLFQSGVKDSLHTTAWTNAREVAKNYIDKVVALPFDNIKRGDNEIIENGSRIFPKVEKVKGMEYKVTCKVFDLAPNFLIYQQNLNRQGITSNHSVGSKLKAITIFVRWKGIGQELEYSLITFKADLSEGTKSDKIVMIGNPRFVSNNN